MSFGMGWKFSQLLKHKNRKRCPRCSLQYAQALQQCPHCGELDANELAELKTRLEQHHRANFRLGKLFIYLALITIIGLVLLNT